MKNEDEFIKKLFEDDNFIRDFYKNGGINRKADKNKKNEIMVEAANKMGYSIGIEGIEAASKKYFKDKGIWKTIKIFFHFNKVVKQLEKSK